MKPLEDFRVKRKLVANTVLASGAALLVAAAIFLIYGHLAARQQMVQSLQATAAVTAATAAPGVTRNEGRSVDEVLQALGAQPEILQACVYDRQGRLLARYTRDRALPAPPVRPAGHHFEGHRLKLCLPILQSGATVGTLYLEEDSRSLAAGTWPGVGIAALVILVGCGIALLLSVWLHATIFEPLSALAATVATVRNQRDYSVRVGGRPNDELGSLIDGFNDMLAQIQERDATLERRVQERTEELTKSVSVLDATLDSTADGILVVNCEGKKIFQNRRTVELWKLPPDIAAGDDDAAQFRHVTGLVVDPAEFTKQATYFHTHPDESGRRETELKDGTILERITGPVRDREGRIHGRIWSFRDVTQRHRYEAAMRESEANYHSLVDQVPAGIFRLDQAGRYVFVNPYFCRMHQAQPADYLGKLPRDLAPKLIGDAGAISPQTSRAAAAERHHAEIMLHQRPIEVEELYCNTDGTVQDFHTVLSPVVDASGQVIGSQGFLFDITGRKQAEQALRESEAKYYSLVDQMPVGIFRKDQEGRFVYVNPVYCRLKGGQPADFLGRMPLETVIPDRGQASADAAALATNGTRHHAEIMRTGRQMEFDERQTNADGQVSYIHSVKSAVYGPDGSIVGSQGVLLDVTQRRQAEAALAYERDLLRALLESSPDSIYFKDRQSRYVRQSRSETGNLFRIALQRHRRLNPASAVLPPHLTSLERFQDYLIGKTDADIYGPEYAAEFLREEQEVMRTGQPLVGKVERFTGAEGDVWFLTTKSVWRNLDHEVIGICGTSQNITPLKAAEAQIEQTHRQLLEASRLAGMAEVATSVLHNVGNVLNSVNVSATLVLELVRKSRLNRLGRVADLVQEHRDRLGEFFTTDPRGQQLPDYLSKLTRHLADEQAQLIAETELTRKNIEHIKDIVTMQQNYAKYSGVVETVQVTELVDDALRMNAGALARHQVEVTRDYPNQPVKGPLERQKVLQILINLIRNAKYACDESGRSDKRLTLQVRSGEGRLQIIVQDNGVGIPAENLTRIFNHGFTTREAGHGFGLHSSAIAAKELGGSLAAQSEGPGLGARFVLDLPWPTRSES